MALTFEEQRKLDETNAALARSQSFTDGRRRVVPVKDQTISTGTGMLTFKATEIIQDVYRIALMEKYSIDFVDLNVNDRKKRPVADESKGEAIVRTDNVNALADALGVDRTVVADALFGKQDQIDRAAEIIHAQSPSPADEMRQYRGMIVGRFMALCAALDLDEEAMHAVVDVVTGDPKIDLNDVAATLRAAIAPPVIIGASADDLGAPIAPAKTDGAEGDEFEPGTPPV